MAHARAVYREWEDRGKHVDVIVQCAARIDDAESYGDFAAIAAELKLLRETIDRLEEML